MEKVKIRGINTFRKHSLLNLAAKASLLVVIFISSMRVAGWITGIPILKNFTPQYAEMKLITALLLLLSSFSLWAVLRQNPWSRLLLRVTGGLIIGVSLLTFMTYLRRNEPHQHHSFLLNYFLQPDYRMAFITSLIFLFLGIIFILLGNNSRIQDGIAHILFFPAASLSYFVFISYILGVFEIFRIEGILTAPVTAFSLFLLCLVILFVKPDTWLMRILSGPNVGSIMGRRLLPWLLILPVTIAWLRIQGDYLHYFPSEIGAIVVAVTYTLSFLFLVWWSAWSVNRVDESRRESEELFSQAFHNIPVSATITRISDNRMVNVNSNFLKLFEYSSAEVIGHTTRELNLFADYGQRMKSLESLTREGYIQDHEFDMLTKTGKQLTLLISSVIVTIHEQKHVLTTYFDITERKETERKMGQLSAIIQHSELAIVSNDLNGMILTWNTGAEKIYGYTAQKATGENISILFPRGENNEFPELMNKVLQDEKIENYETNHLHKDGTVIPVSITLSPIRNASGAVIAVSSISYDLSELKKAEEALRAKEREEAMRKGAERAMAKLHEELMRSNNEFQQFAYLTSHDLQEPLRIITTFTQFLSQRYKGQFDPEGDKFIHYIVESAARMKSLIHDLLIYSRVASHSSPFTEVDFNKVFNKVVHHFENIIQKKNAIINHGELPFVFGDESQLVQLLQNLVDNSLKFCHKTPHIHIAAKEEPEEYLFSVSDNGIGIDHKYSHKIFLIFQRLVDRHEYEGTGIGLAVCKRIAERHGGNICFESKVGEGTTFYFTIAKNHEHSIFQTETRTTQGISVS